MSSSPLLPASERDPDRSPHSYARSTRLQTRRFLTSKFAHFTILAVVALDVACLFADIIINLFTCTQEPKSPPIQAALKALEYISLTFSSLFMLELLGSIWAFGKTYFYSKFHIFDATIIIVSFILEVTLQGITEEVASLVVILRLVRVVKIVDEMSVGAEEQMLGLEERIAHLERENGDLKEEVQRLRSR